MTITVPSASDAFEAGRVLARDRLAVKLETRGKDEVTS